MTLCIEQACGLQGEVVSNHDELMCNFFAQADALATGKTAVELRAENVPDHLIPHKTFTGNRPSLSILLPELNAYSTGQILAMYEHRVAVQVLFRPFSLLLVGQEGSDCLTDRKQMEPTICAGKAECQCLQQLLCWHIVVVVGKEQACCACYCEDDMSTCISDGTENPSIDASILVRWRLCMQLFTCDSHQSGMMPAFLSSCHFGDCHK